MAYTSLTAILTIVPGLPQSNVDGSGYTETALVVGAHITRADSIINGKIAKRYSIPISPTPPLLSTISEDLTAYFTFRSFYSQDNHNKFEYFDELKQDALNNLEQIREGNLDLFDSTGSIIVEASTTGITLVDSTNIDYQPFFDVDDDFDWKFPNDQLNSVRDSRND